MALHDGQSDAKCSAFHFVQVLHISKALGHGHSDAKCSAFHLVQVLHISKALGHGQSDAKCSAFHLVQVLHMGDNTLGPLAGASLGAALVVTQSLSELRLPRCRVEPAFWKRLGEFCKRAAPLGMCTCPLTLLDVTACSLGLHAHSVQVSWTFLEGTWKCFNTTPCCEGLLG
jgi:hypothetical protein